jgi:hypothetical protein
MEREIAMAAAESARFAQFAERSNVGPHTLEQFQADLRRIAETYPNRPVYPIFAELRELRKRTFELLEGRQLPDQTRDLYLVSAALCGALGLASFDLGRVAAAETQMRTAYLCAELAGHNGLRSWIRGTQALIAYWDNRPQVAVELAADGWRYEPETGTARVRLAAIEARAWARLRDQHGAEDALRRAEQAREQVNGPDEPGGIMAFPQAQQLGHAATTRLWLGGQTNLAEAERLATEAIELYEQDIPEQRRLGALSLARLDVAAARLVNANLEGVAEQVEEVFELASQRPIESVRRRLLQIATALERPAYQTSGLALDLRDQIITSSGRPALAPPGSAQ